MAYISWHPQCGFKALLGSNNVTDPAENEENERMRAVWRLALQYKKFRAIEAAVDD